MGLRMLLGDGEKHHHEEKYIEGYHTGYEHGMEEAKRRTSGTWETERDLDEEMRHRRAMMDAEMRHRMMEEEMRRRTRDFLPMNREYEGHYPQDMRHMDPEGHYPQEQQFMPFWRHPEEGMGRAIGFRPESMHKGMDSKEENGVMGMAKKLTKIDPRLVGVLESAMTVLENPPSTWAQYMHRKDYAGIAKMEGKELMTALEARKPISDIRKELTHTLAALFQMASA